VCYDAMMSLCRQWAVVSCRCAMMQWCRCVVQVSAVSCGLLPLCYDAMMLLCRAGVGNEWQWAVVCCRCAMMQWCRCVVQVSAMSCGLLLLCYDAMMLLCRAGVGNELWSAAVVLWCNGVGWSAFLWRRWWPAAAECCHWLIKQGRGHPWLADINGILTILTWCVRIRFLRATASML